MSAHTPGPWRIGDAGRTIFGAPNGSPSPVTVAHLGKNFRADGPVIAEAPAMLEALRKLLARCELDFIANFEQENLNSDGNDYEMELVNARAILARIEGGKS